MTNTIYDHLYLILISINVKCDVFFKDLHRAHDVQIWFKAMQKYFLGNFFQDISKETELSYVLFEGSILLIKCWYIIWNNITDNA